MAALMTSRVEVRKAVLAVAAALADGCARLKEPEEARTSMGAAIERLIAAEGSLVCFAATLAACINRRYTLDTPHKEALLVLKVDYRDVEAFSGDWLHAAEALRVPGAPWHVAHLVNAIDFGRWVVALSAGAIAGQHSDAELHSEAVRTILDLDLALTELTRGLLGTRARCLLYWNAA